jgi:hypothetical protein
MISQKVIFDPPKSLFQSQPPPVHLIIPRNIFNRCPQRPRNRAPNILMNRLASNIRFCFFDGFPYEISDFCCTFFVEALVLLFEIFLGRL